MTDRNPLDDRTADAVLSGRSVPDASPDIAALCRAVADVRAVPRTAAAPTPELQRILTEGIPTDKGDLPATAASNVHGPARAQVSGPPKWRRRTMIEIIAAKLAAVGLATKAGVASAAVLAATAGAGAGGALPDAAQAAFDELRGHAEEADDLVIEDVEIAEAEETESDGALDPDGGEDTLEFDEGEEADESDDAESFGDRVSRDASDPASPGVDGGTIADEASEGRSTAGRDRAADAADAAPDRPQPPVAPPAAPAPSERPAPPVQRPAPPEPDADEGDTEETGETGAQQSEDARRGPAGPPSR